MRVSWTWTTTHQLPVPATTTCWPGSSAIGTSCFARRLCIWQVLRIYVLQSGLVGGFHVYCMHVLCRDFLSVLYTYCVHVYCVCVMYVRLYVCILGVYCTCVLFTCIARANCTCTTYLQHMWIVHTHCILQADC